MDDLGSHRRQLARVQASLSRLRGSSKARAERSVCGVTAVEKSVAMEHDARRKALRFLSSEERNLRARLLEAYRPMYEQELALIEQASEALGNRRTVERLKRTRWANVERRVELEVRRKKVNEWALSDLVKAEQTKMVEEERARRLALAEKRKADEAAARSKQTRSFRSSRQRTPSTSSILTGVPAASTSVPATPTGLQPVPPLTTIRLPAIHTTTASPQ